VFTLRDYPNSRYFAGVDLAITAAGYNTFHELLYLGVPSILIPNQETRTDDQVARSLAAEQAGAAIVVLNQESIATAISRGLEEAVSAAMRTRASQLVPDGGAMAMAEHIVSRAGASVPSRQRSGMDRMPV
jgi:UDP-N-acetylglucosamine:LPS N-acetylglucosamine transferase